MKKTKEKFLFLTISGWYHIPFQRIHHFAKYFKENYEVITLNNVKWLTFTKLNFKTREHKEVLDKIKNIYQIGYIKKFPFFRKINKFLKKIQYYFIFQSQDFKDSKIIYTCEVSNLDYLKKAKTKLIIYDAMDEWDELTGDVSLAKNEAKLASKADIVIVTSEKIYKKLEKYNSKIHLVSNGVDVEFFKKALSYDKNKNDEMFLYQNKPIIGYIGCLDYVNTDLIIETAKILPEMQFIFIGFGDKHTAQKLSSIQNIEYLGAKNYNDLISYISYFSVGIIPFTINKLIDSTNPVKMYEYLGAGIPVVSTPMKEVKKLAKKGVIYTAETPELFATALFDAVNPCHNKLSTNKIPPFRNFFIIRISRDE